MQTKINPKMIISPVFSFRTRVTATILLLTIISPYLTPSTTALCLTEDEWVIIFDQDFSKIDTVPSNIHAIKRLDTEQSAIEISKRSEDNFLLITKGTDDRGTVDIFGFPPSIKCRYILDLEWSNSHSASWLGAGVYISVGGVRLYSYSSSGGSRFYLRGGYFNASNEFNSIFVWDLGTSNRVSITIDTDTTVGKAYISYKNYKAELPFYRFFWEEDKIQTDKNNTVELPYYRYRWREAIQNTFTPDTILLVPLSAQSANSDDSTVIKLFRVTQAV
ncbi:hypothetical protein KA005_28700, partial [bacterium]|nr:hypothetical protein [bacterium]